MKWIYIFLLYILLLKSTLAEKPMTVDIVSLGEIDNGSLDVGIVLNNSTSESSNTPVKFKIFQGSELKLFYFENIWVKWKSNRIVNRTFDISTLHPNETGSLEVSASHSDPKFGENLSVDLQGFQAGPKRTINDLTDISQVVSVVFHNILEMVVFFFLFLDGALNGR